MTRFVLRPLLMLLLTGIGILTVAAQNDPWDPFSERNGRPKEDDHILKDMLSKQKREQDKKDYDEMVQRGTEAAAIAADLDESYKRSGNLTPSEKQKLNDLEKLVKKIRDELGGNDDGEASDSDDDTPKVKKPLSTGDAIDLLKDSTLRLVDEIKRSTRFTISAVAIQSSNSIIKVIRFLRFRN